MSAAQTIVDVAAGNPEFSTLVTALKAAGLEKTLADTGPFTVFAPNNAAFDKLPKADLTALLANKAQLTKVLTYHVVSGKVAAADVMKMDGKKAQSVEVSDLNVSIKGQKVEINDAMVIKADIGASNGVIHCVDTVLMPKMN